MKDMDKLVKVCYKFADLMTAKVCFANCRRESYRETHLLNPGAPLRRTLLIFKWYKSLSPEDKAKYPSELIAEIDRDFEDVIGMLAEEIIIERRYYFPSGDVATGDIPGRIKIADYLDDLRYSRYYGIVDDSILEPLLDLYPLLAPNGSLIPIPLQEIVAGEIGLTVDDLRRAQERIDRGTPIKWSLRLYTARTRSR